METYKLLALEEAIGEKLAGPDGASLGVSHGDFSDCGEGSANWMKIQQESLD